MSKGVTQDRQRDFSARRSRQPRTNFQLEGFWLHLSRWAWIGFMLVELLVLILTLVATRGRSLTICPFIVSCDVTPATVQALHRLSIAPTSYATYNLVLGLLQSLVFLSVGGFIFWRKPGEPVGLVASFFLVSIGLGAFFPSTTYPPYVIFGYIGVPCIFAALGYFLVTFPDGHFIPRWSWLLVVLWMVQAIFYVIPGPFNIMFWPPLLSAAEEVVTNGGALGVFIYRYVRVFSASQRQQAKWLLFGLGGLIVLSILYDLIGSLVPGLGAPDSLYQLANGTLTFVIFLFVPLSVAIAILRSRLWEIDVIIRRTLIYGMLTVVLTGVYVGLVIGLSALLRGLIRQDNSVAIIISTLVIYALIGPLRIRSQPMSRCGCVHLNMMENSGLLVVQLLFLLREDEEGKGFLAHPHFHALSMKGNHDDGNERAALCPAHPCFFRRVITSGPLLSAFGANTRFVICARVRARELCWRWASVH